jgi:hypothetical protein
MADRLRNDPRCVNDSAEDIANNVVGALVHGGPTPALLVKRALKDHWPEAAAIVHIGELDQQRTLIHMMTYRPRVVHYLEKLTREWEERDEVEACPCGREDADLLLDEWDVTKTPNQVPEPRRTMALERLRRSGMLDG